MISFLKCYFDWIQMNCSSVHIAGCWNLLKKCSCWRRQLKINKFTSLRTPRSSWNSFGVKWIFSVNDFQRSWIPEFQQLRSSLILNLYSDSGFYSSSHSISFLYKFSNLFKYLRSFTYSLFDSSFLHRNSSVLIVTFNFTIFNRFRDLWIRKRLDRKLFLSYSFLRGR